jgi:CRP-like cAMP-binding protein
MPRNGHYSGVNHILNAFDEDTMGRLSPHLEHVELELGEFLYHPHTEITHVYFPEKSMVSLVATTSDGRSSEIGIVGREGFVGWEVIMGDDSSPNECIIQIANSGHLLPASVLVEEFYRCGTAHDVLLSFVNKLIIKISQTTLCNKLHLVEERLCRRLLMCHDRVDGDTIMLTHEFLAGMLGVTRASVTMSASALQAAGLIKYTRGNITILDREGLLDLACECYNIVKTAYDRPKHPRLILNANT